MLKRSHFRTAAPLLPLDQLERQGRIAREAWQFFGNVGLVTSFLGDFHQGLGGRPLDIATASQTGFDGVLSEMHAQPHHQEHQPELQKEEKVTEKLEGTSAGKAPVNGASSAKVAADDLHKAEKLTAPSVDGDLDEVEE